MRPLYRDPTAYTAIRTVIRQERQKRDMEERRFLEMAKRTMSQEKRKKIDELNRKRESLIASYKNKEITARECVEERRKIDEEVKRELRR